LLFAAAMAALVALLIAPVFCSQASDDERPRCDALLGYWTPVSEAGSGVLLALFVALLGAALLGRRG
jgi:hypothetical protein